MSSSIDYEFTNGLERALGTDENLAGTLAGRSIAEALRLLVGSPTFLGHQGLGSTDANLFNMETRTRVFGLAIETITAGPRQFTIGAGALLSNTGAEAPTADDSTFRLGLHLAPVAVAIPASDDLWHLLECRVVNTDVTEARDILTNVVTRTYAPQVVVKRKLKRLVFQITTGTGSAIPAPTAGWTPLYGFVIPTTGLTLPVMSQIVDLRQSAPSSGVRTENEEDGTFKGVTRVVSRELQTFSSMSFPGTSQGVAFRFRAELDGDQLHAHTVNTTADITRFLSGGGAPAASTWYYIYLARPPVAMATAVAGNACYGGRQEPVVSNCVVLLSSQSPRSDGRNGVALACVAPFSGSNIAIGDAVCVGCLKQDPGAAGWDPMTVSADGHARMSSVNMMSSVAVSGMVGVANGASTSAFLPINMVKHVDLQFGMIARTPSQSGAGVNGLLLVTPVLQGVIQVNNAQSFGSMLINPLIQEAYQSISCPLDTSNLVSPTGVITFKVETRSSTGVIGAALLSEVCNVGASLQCRCYGFQM